MSPSTVDQTQLETLGILTRAGALIRDTHVVYRSWKHGDTYVNKDAVYPNPVTMSRVAQLLAESFMDEHIDAVLAPALGGVLIGHLTAYHLTLSRSRICPTSVFAEKTRGDGYRLARGYGPLLKGKRVLIVDDVLTTGSSVRKLVELAHGLGCTVVGVGALCNRGGVTAADMGIERPEQGGFPPPRFVSLAAIPFEAWEERVCPLCARGVPINVEIGRGREYLARRDATFTQRLALVAIDRLQRLVPWRQAA